MKYQNGSGIIAVLVLSFLVFASFSVHAKPINKIRSGMKFDSYKAVIEQTLTRKLRADLADETVLVKLNNVIDYEISTTHVTIDGNALAIVTGGKSERPLQFNAKVNRVNLSADDLSYNFVESTSEFAPSLTEDNLMKELMTRISKDYKTTNIVISIDGFDTKKLTINQIKYQGIGEVRIGDFEWRKIKFDVVLDSQNNTATKILYNIQK